MNNPYSIEMIEKYHDGRLIESINWIASKTEMTYEQVRLVLFYSFENYQNQVESAFVS